MNREECERVHINDCVRDDEIENARALYAAAEPGEWLARDGKIVRHSGAPVSTAGSIAFMAAAVSLVPRLLRGIATLENALRTSWAETASWRAEHRRAKDESDAALDRAKKGETGSDWSLLVVCEAYKLNVIDNRSLMHFLGRWARGEEVGNDLNSHTKSAEVRLARAKFYSWNERWLWMWMFVGECVKRDLADARPATKRKKGVRA